MSEMNSQSGMPAPAETKSNSGGTVFFTGNEGQDEDEGSDLSSPEIAPGTDAAGGSAAVLDQVLRRIGYSVENESGTDSSSAGTASASVNRSGAAASEDSSAEPDPALVIEPEEEKTGKPASGLGFDQDPALGMELDPALIETEDQPDLPSKSISGGYDPDDEPDDTEIPWDLFGTADMSLPQTSDEPVYRTFSRTGIPKDSGATTYQQRMLSSVLGKIIHAENFVPPEKKINARAISFWSRIFWSFLAIAGVVLILTSEIILS